MDIQSTPANGNLGGDGGRPAGGVGVRSDAVVVDDWIIDNNQWIFGRADYNGPPDSQKQQPQQHTVFVSFNSRSFSCPGVRPPPTLRASDVFCSLFCG